MGVLGLGVMGRNHLKAIANGAKLDVVAVADRYPDLLDDAPSGSFRALDAFEVIDHRGLDAVIVATPTTTHYAIAMAALEAGLHVLLEKPMAMEVRECAALVELADRKGLRLMIGFVERFNPALLAAKRELASIGRIQNLHATRLTVRPPRIIDVGVGFDTAIHDIDLLLHLAGETPDRVTSTVGPKGRLEEHLVATMSFRSGVIAGLEASFESSHRRRELRIAGTEGEIVVDLLRRSAMRYTFEGSQVSEHPIAVEPKDALIALHGEFVASIREDREPSVNGVDGMRAVELLHRLLQP